MKSIDLQSKVIFANTLAPHGMKGQFPKNYFAGKLMKHPDLHRKLKFTNVPPLMRVLVEWR